MIQLILCIQNGWPETKRQLPLPLHPFWNYRSQLAYMNGVIFKRSKAFVPPVMRKRMLEKIHASHQGIEKSILNATDTMFWPAIRSDIKTACENCMKCAQYATQNQKEPMLHQPVPDLPWQMVSQDLFQHEHSNYLITVDHYSDFFEFNKLPNTLASTVIQFTKHVFSRHGTPHGLSY